MFNLAIPDQVEGVPADLLKPEAAWSDKNSYKETVNKLAVRSVSDLRPIKTTAS